MSKYSIMKEKARQKAIEWQISQERAYGWTWSECAAWKDYWYRIGKRYGLIREFIENGIL